jgi:hypothetical protein
MNKSIENASRDNAIRYAKLNWKDITQNMDFFYVCDLKHYQLIHKPLNEIYKDNFENYSNDIDVINNRLKIAEQVLGSTSQKFQDLKKKVEEIKVRDIVNCDNCNKEIDLQHDEYDYDDAGFLCKDCMPNENNDISAHLKEFPTHKYCEACECCINCECCECV